MTTPIDGDKYQRLTIREGEAPFLMGKVTDKAGTIIVKADIATITATILNITAGTTALAATVLAEATVWNDTYQTLTDADGDVITYNFGWQTTSTWFATTTYADDVQFKVEVWVTPESGQPFAAGWWIITAKKSIVPLS
jgi:outer membrane lipoprotein-sorting protein